MSRGLKDRMVEEYARRFESVRDCILVDPTGMPAESARELRGRLRDEGGELLVLRNRLARVAFDRVGIEGLDGRLAGPTAAAFRGDAVSLARILCEWSKKEKGGVVLKGGLLAGRPLEPAEVEALAALPDRETMLSQVLATVIAPMTQVANLLSSTLAQVANLVSNHIGKMEGGET